MIITLDGQSGTGKSTLANNLGRELNLPVYHLDGIHHLENWEKRDKKERDKIFLEKIEARTAKSEMIIFLNYSTIAKLKGILSRYFKHKGKEKPDIPGCKERMSLEFIKFTIKWNKTRGSTIKSVLEKNKDKQIIIFKNRKTLNKWYKKEFNKKIELVKF